MTYIPEGDLLSSINMKEIFLLGGKGATPVLLKILALIQQDT